MQNRENYAGGQYAVADFLFLNPLRMDTVSNSDGHGQNIADKMSSANTRDALNSVEQKQGGNQQCALTQDGDDCGGEGVPGGLQEIEFRECSPERMLLSPLGSPRAKM